MTCRYPLSCFFVLAFGLSWLGWAPYILSDTGLGILPFRLPALLDDEQTLGVAPGALLGPITAAFLVTAATNGRAGLRRWAGRLVRLRVGWSWYLAVLLGVPVVIVLATLPVPGAWGNVHLPTTSVLLMYVPTLFLQLVFTSLAEEPGWRDFAVPRLQERHGPLVGAFILGPLWGAWHLPLFLSEWGGWPNVEWLTVVEFVGVAIPLSIVMTWLFNRTGESLPLVMLFHANINTVFSLVWAEIFPTLTQFRDSLHPLLFASVVFAVVLLVATRGQLGYRPAELRPTG
jgi:membrane protease YdiL (CAAX protease family)